MLMQLSNNRSPKVQLKKIQYSIVYTIYRNRYFVFNFVKFLFRHVTGNMCCVTSISINVILSFSQLNFAIYSCTLYNFSSPNSFILLLPHNFTTYHVLLPHPSTSVLDYCCTLFFFLPHNFTPYCYSSSINHSIFFSI